MLKRDISLLQWCAVVLLGVGVALTKVGSNQAGIDLKRTHGIPALGFTAVAMAAITSGFAGVFTEMVFKSGETSVWIRNVKKHSTGPPAF